MLLRSCKVGKLEITDRTSLSAAAKKIEFSPSHDSPHSFAAPFDCTVHRKIDITVYCIVSNVQHYHQPQASELKSFYISIVKATSLRNPESGRMYNLYWKVSGP